MMRNTRAMVQAGSSVLGWVTCLLLAFPATVTGPKVIPPEVDTLLGRVRGRQVGVKGTDRMVNVFLGVPFAQAPLGPLRFSAPLPPQPWEGVRDATTNPPMCLQDGERMSNSRFTLNEKFQIFSVSEDCLILNVYSPADITAGARKPVMVWIHGGSLMVGAATSQDGSALAAYGDVVVVTVQYRLGIFGFLSTGDKHMPGNQGLLDVVAALHWVQGNIAPFGGDPNCVTIFGNSVGGMIVSFLVLSPVSAGLFHRAISQSGVVTNMMKEMDPGPVAQSFANSMACSSVSSAELVQCLLRKEGKELIKQKNVRISYVINDSFFPQSPETLLTEKQFPTVPYLLGVNNHEFGWLMFKVWGILDKLEHLSKEDLLETSRPFLAILDVPHEVMSTIIDEYLGNASDAAATRYAFQELLGDIMFVIPTLNFSRHLQGAGCPVFLYEFQHTPSSFAKFKPAWVKADHGSESAFVFGGPFLTDESSLLAFPEATEEEKQLSLTMMAQWTQFAYTGNPNAKGLPPWPQLNQLEQYLEIGVEPQTGVKLKKERLQFWTETLPGKIQKWQQHQKSRKASEEL
ncbi:carboxylesterase 3 [Acomys russatus]|uniref:carboxylesterase 3 n=1 Tax=Acomys russatus TaxID=60746 RepID=UPI0021E2DA5B|nr:carboxylesterase 3 [Acomys russatus]